MVEKWTPRTNSRRAGAAPSKILVIAFAVAVVIAVLTIVAYKTGRADARAKLETATSQLATSVHQKADYVAKLNDLYDGWTANADTIDKTGIDQYTDKLETLVKDAKNQEISSALAAYLAKWQHLQEIYDEKDNEAIMQAFEEIKKSAASTAETMQKILDADINAALENLSHLE